MFPEAVALDPLILGGDVYGVSTTPVVEDAAVTVIPGTSGPGASVLEPLPQQGSQVLLDGISLENLCVIGLCRF